MTFFSFLFFSKRRLKWKLCELWSSLKIKTCPFLIWCLMIKPLNIDYNPSRLGQNNEQLESNSPIYIQCLLIKTFMTYVLKFLILRLRLQPNVRNVPTVQHWIIITVKMRHKSSTAWTYLNRWLLDRKKPKNVSR